jgi:hypothetical protein
MYGYPMLVVSNDPHLSPNSILNDLKVPFPHTRFVTASLCLMEVLHPITSTMGLQSPFLEAPLLPLFSLSG